MASRTKTRTTMAKLNRERAVQEKRELKEKRKAARKAAASLPPVEHEHDAQDDASR